MVTFAVIINVMRCALPLVGCHECVNIRYDRYMNKIKKAFLLSVLAAAPAVALSQPGVMSSEAAGYLERGRLMYESRNYVGAIDQLEHMKQLPADVSMREQADYYIALSRFEQGDEEGLLALQRFIDTYPGSPLAVEAQLKVGNHYFYRG